MIATEIRMPTHPNPVLYQYKGKNVRLYNVLRIKVSAIEFKKFIDLRIDEKLSARKAIQERGLLCSSTRFYNKSLQSKSNPVIEIYRDTPVKLYNELKINISQFELKKFVDLKIDFNLSVRQAIQEKRFLCNCDDPLNYPQHGKSIKPL